VPLDANEDGDTCAWVSEKNPVTVQGPPEPIPGAIGDITGNAGGTFAVEQRLGRRRRLLRRRRDRPPGRLT
jgi:hypothetical protein